MLRSIGKQSAGNPWNQSWRGKGRLLREKDRQTPQALCLCPSQIDRNCNLFLLLQDRLPSISPYLYQSWHLPSSSQDPLLPAGLPLHLTPLLLRLRFGFADHCARLEIIFTYLLTYMIPQTFTVTSEHIRLYFSVFFLFFHFLVVVSVE